MKFKIIISVLVFSLLSVSCTLDDLCNAYIKHVEFGDDYTTLIVTYDGPFGDTEVCAHVYPDSLYSEDIFYSIKKQRFTRSSNKNIVELNKEVPVGAWVVVTPAENNTSLNGRGELYREK